jgi:hypothetical protein
VCCSRATLVDRLDFLRGGVNHLDDVLYSEQKQHGGVSPPSHPHRRRDAVHIATCATRCGQATDSICTSSRSDARARARTRTCARSRADAHPRTHARALPPARPHTRTPSAHAGWARPSPSDEGAAGTGPCPCYASRRPRRRALSRSVPSVAEGVRSGAAVAARLTRAAIQLRRPSRSGVCLCPVCSWHEPCTVRTLRRSPARCDRRKPRFMQPRTAVTGTHDARRGTSSP